MTEETLKSIAIQVIRNEKDAIAHLESYIDDSFVKIVNCIFNSKGRVVVSGIGKSANIGTKMVSTFNSTGTPAIFMHAADAIHGDLGMIQKEDIIICLSKSGNTPEIKVLVPLIKGSGNILIGMVGNMDSYLAKQADYIINTMVDREACPNNLAPTSSTTAQLVMGDALAVALLERRGFTAEDFAKYHPGGALGKRLYLKVSDLYIQNESPQVSLDTDMRSVILEMTSKRLGCTAVVENEYIKGIITDGDLRRMLQRADSMDSLKAEDVMSRNPKSIQKDELAINALARMRDCQIQQLLVTNNLGKYVGVVHLHDLIREGII